MATSSCVKASRYTLLYAATTPKRFQDTSSLAISSIVTSTLFLSHCPFFLTHHPFFHHIAPNLIEDDMACIDGDVMVTRMKMSWFWPCAWVIHVHHQIIWTRAGPLIINAKKSPLHYWQKKKKKLWVGSRSSRSANHIARIKAVKSIVVRLSANERSERRYFFCPS